MSPVQILALSTAATFHLSIDADHSTTYLINASTQRSYGCLHWKSIGHVCESVCERVC